MLKFLLSHTRTNHLKNEIPDYVIHNGKQNIFFKDKERVSIDLSMHNGSVDGHGYQKLTDI